MQIRPLDKADLPEIVRMLDAFRGALGLDIPPDAASVAASFELYMTLDSVMLVADKDGAIVGMIAALGYPYPMNTSYTVADELFWWVDENHRSGSVGLKLIAALEAEATRRGWYALSLCAATESSSFDSTCRFYARKGFRVSDHKYWKELNHA